MSDFERDKPGYFFNEGGLTATVSTGSQAKPIEQRAQTGALIHAQNLWGKKQFYLQFLFLYSAYKY